MVGTLRIARIDRVAALGRPLVAFEPLMPLRRIAEGTGAAVGARAEVDFRVLFAPSVNNAFRSKPSGGGSRETDSLQPAPQG